MSIYLIDLHIYVASMAVFEVITLLYLTNEIHLISALAPELSPKPMAIRRQDPYFRYPSFRYSYAPMHPYPMAPEASGYAPTYAYPPGPPGASPYGTPRKPPPYYPIPASSISYASYASKSGPPKPLSPKTAAMVAKYAPPPKRFIVPKYYLKPVPVPYPVPHDYSEHRPRYPPRPRGPRPVKYDKFSPNDAISKDESKEASESNRKEVKTKSKNEDSSETYVEIGGIGYKSILNTLSNTLSSVKLGADNAEEDDNSNNRVRERKVKFKLGASSKKPSPFIQFGQSKLTFQQENGGMTITLGKVDS